MWRAHGRRVPRALVTAALATLAGAANPPSEFSAVVQTDDTVQAVVPTDNTVRAVVPTDSTARCTEQQLTEASGSRSVNIEVGGTLRRFVLHAPAYYAAEAPLPLWILAPGTDNSAEDVIRESELEQLSEQQQFAFLALQGVDNSLNVVAHAAADPNRPDDVAYTRAALAVATSTLCIDKRRIFCTGYSRGGRFCMRLASELSNVIAAVAPVSGVRFPEPNNATRRVPVIAFHGTDDPVNPFGGNGDPQYWHEPVPDAVERLASFNGCGRSNEERLTSSISLQRHVQCEEGASIYFVQVDGGGHTWPGSRFAFDAGLGRVTAEIRAGVMMSKFFARHPLPMGFPSERVLGEDMPAGNERLPHLLEWASPWCFFLASLALPLALAGAAAAASQRATGREVECLAEISCVRPEGDDESEEEEGELSSAEASSCSGSGCSSDEGEGN